MSGKGEKRGPKPRLTDSAKKLHRQECNAKLNRSKIYIGDQFDRWIALRQKLNVKTNVDLARTLMDSYEKNVFLHVVVVDRDYGNNKEDIFKANTKTRCRFHPFESSVPGPSRKHKDNLQGKELDTTKYPHDDNDSKIQRGRHRDRE